MSLAVTTPPRPINAKAESVSNPTFRDAYALRRCIVAVDGFFERWRWGKPLDALAENGGAHEQGENMLFTFRAWLARRMSSIIMARIFSVPCSW
jgi:putative SOS response-associated peptidase YedK